MFELSTYLSVDTLKEGRSVKVEVSGVVTPHDFYIRKVYFNIFGRQKQVYRLCANFRMPPEVGIPSARYVNPLTAVSRDPAENFL